MAGIFSKIKEIKHAWNVFQNLGKEAAGTDIVGYGGGVSYGSRPDRTRLRLSNERSIIASILTRMAVDAASVGIFHTRVDDDGVYQETLKTGLNDCLTVEANIDQGARAFRQDIYSTMFDEGSCAIVPVRVTENTGVSANVDIFDMRVARIISWMPQHVRVSVYNDRTGYREELNVPKRYAAVVENPLYSVMNEYNSTLQRLIRKLGILDVIDEQAGSGKLDLILQLPYVVKSPARKEAAEQRRADIEVQLKDSKYGIAYTDGTEKITQLNRPAENNLLNTVEYLTKMLYGQLGLTEDILNGSADEKTMLNYQARTIEPLVSAVVEAMRRTFLTKTARSQGQTISYFSDPFKLVPLSEIAEIADKFTRNEILSGNELRGFIGVRPSKDPKADELRNSNMPEPKPEPPPSKPALPQQKVLELEAAPQRQLESRGTSQNGS